jgi:hypothetical protein
MRTLFVAPFVLLSCQAAPPEAEPPAEFPEFPALEGSSRPQIPDYVVSQLTPEIDGSIDEWTEVPWAGALVSPGDGTAIPESPVAGNFKLGWDADHLYAAVIVRDINAASPLARDAVDPHVWEVASGIELMLQPGDPGDNSHYFEIQVCTAGAVWDTRFDDYNRPTTGEGDAREFGHQSWDAALQRSVRVVPGRGYVVELALPWSTLQSPHTNIPPEAGHTWRANVYSFRDGQGHSLAWSPLLGQGNFHRASRFGRLLFE